MNDETRIFFCGGQIIGVNSIYIL